MRVADVVEIIEELAPPHLAFSFDRIGLQIGAADDPVTGIAVALDPSPGLLKAAKAAGASLLVVHHPPIWDPLKCLPGDSIVHQMIRQGFACFGVHTNWDCADGGINDVLADRLGLVNVRPFGSPADSEQFLVTVYVPENRVEAVIDAAAGAGAGEIGAYRRCAFSAGGVGTFEPQPGAHPTVGAVGQREHVAETRVEVRVPTQRWPAVEAAIRAAHTYEEPAIHAVKIAGSAGQAIGRIGHLNTLEHMNLASFAQHVDTCLGTRCLAWGDDRPISKVAVVGGAAADEMQAASAAGADVFVTGEIPHHLTVNPPIPIIAAGHYATEHPGMMRMAEIIQSRLDVPVLAYEPEPGQDGRPR